MTTTRDIDTLGAAKYISLTTFRADGRPVATPVWVVRDGETLRVLTDPTSGKVRRLRANPRASVAVCDMRGRTTTDARSVPVVVTLQDAAGTSDTMARITSRYGLTGRLLGWMNSRKARKAAGGEIQHVGLVLRLDDPGANPDPS
jgi:PPOX class probable F420-dependent enzyme